MVRAHLSRPQGRAWGCAFIISSKAAHAGTRGETAVKALDRSARFRQLSCPGLGGLWGLWEEGFTEKMNTRDIQGAGKGRGKALGRVGKADTEVCGSGCGRSAVCPWVRGL